MSAFIVSRFHIHQLVTAIDTYVSPTEEPSALGHMLWQTNIASVQYRYNDEPLSDLPGPCDETYQYEYVTPQRQLTPVEVYAVARCYAYQSCERDDWEDSEAYGLIDVLCTALQTRLGKTDEQIRRLPEWDQAEGAIWDDIPREPAAPQETKPVRRMNLVDTAKLVRKALKAAYPTVKFSVRTDRYSMGCSIDVTWSDGPTFTMVKPLLDAFCGTHFDGMTDSKHSITQEYEGEVVKFEVDYVQGQRSISTAFMQQIAYKVAAQYHVAIPEVENSGAKWGTGDHGSIVPSPEANVLIPNAPPFWRDQRVMDVIYHVAHQTSALPKPRIRVMPMVREVVEDTKGA